MREVGHVSDLCVATVFDKKHHARLSEKIKKEEERKKERIRKLKNEKKESTNGTLSLPTHITLHVAI